MKKLKVGQIVYIQGNWKAKITAIHDNRISCDVYEGLPAWTKSPHNYTYQKGLIEIKKRI